MPRRSLRPDHSESVQLGTARHKLDGREGGENIFISSLRGGIVPIAKMGRTICVSYKWSPIGNIDVALFYFYSDLFLSLLLALKFRMKYDPLVAVIAGFHEPIAGKR